MSSAPPQLSPADIAYQTAHIQEDKRPLAIGSLIALSVLATVAVALKFVIRWRLRAGFQADDYSIILALVFGWLSFVQGVYVMRYGIGLHLLAVPPENFKPLAQILYYTWPMYFLGVAVTQMSILFLYKRLFTLLIRWFRITFYALQFLSAGSGISISLALLLRCLPISANWDPTIRGAHCGVNVALLARTSCVVNLVVDMCVIAAPMPLIWKLKVNGPTKAALAGLFLLAGFVCVINVVKLVYSIEAKLSDFTFDTRILIWTHAELTLGIVSACLPCYKPFFSGFRTIVSSVFSTKRSRSTTNSRPKKSHDALHSHSSGTRKKSIVTDSTVELVAVDEWSDASKTPIKIPVASAKSSLAPHDTQRRMASPHSAV